MTRPANVDLTRHAEGLPMATDVLPPFTTFNRRSVHRQSLPLDPSLSGTVSSFIPQGMLG